MKHSLNESAERDRCGRMDDLKERDGQMVCCRCREELDRAGMDRSARRRRAQWPRGVALLP